MGVIPFSALDTAKGSHREVAAWEAAFAALRRYQAEKNPAGVVDRFSPGPSQGGVPVRGWAGLRLCAPGERVEGAEDFVGEARGLERSHVDTCDSISQESRRAHAGGRAGAPAWARAHVCNAGGVQALLRIDHPLSREKVKHVTTASQEAVENEESGVALCATPLTTAATTDYAPAQPPPAPPSDADEGWF